MSQETIRILSLDGGGLRGVFSAAVIKHMEETTGRPAGELFDAIIGTSTGSVLASMLATGKPASDLMTLYKEVGFQDLQHPTPEKRTDAFVSTMKKHLGESRTFGDIKGIRVCIPFRDTRNGEVSFASNFRDDRASWTDLPLWQAVRRSTALPPLFTPVDDRYLDGGYSAFANPSYEALRTAREQGWLKPGKPDALQIHSVGTTHHAPIAGQLGLAGGMGKYLQNRNNSFEPSELLQMFVNDAMIQDVGFLQHQLLKAAQDRGELVYRRYNLKLEPSKLGSYEEKLKDAGIPVDTESLIETYRIMGRETSMERLATIGDIVAKKQFDKSEFPTADADPDLGGY
jgi:predicted acylesterase/phospholipase RssA